MERVDGAPGTASSVAFRENAGRRESRARRERRAPGTCDQDPTTTNNNNNNNINNTNDINE